MYGKELENGKELDIKEIEKICDTWLFKKNENNATLDEFYNKAKEIDFSGPINAFTSRLATIDWKFTKSEQVSGSICFYGGVFTSLLNYGYIENIEGLFTFALCYMLIDHFLDDNTISDSEKEKSMKDVYSFIMNGEKTDNKLLNAGAERYSKLIKENPKTKEYFIKLFQSELKGAYIQKRKDLDRETYLQIAEEKGGFTAAVIGSIIGLEDIEESLKLGQIIQGVDDYLDIGDDSALEIYTLARYDLDNGNMDNYITYTIKKVGELSNVYNFFKPILLLGTILGIHDNPGCISKELDSILQKYNPFSENTSKDSLVKWFHEKLYSYIEEKKNDI